MASDTSPFHSVCLVGWISVSDRDSQAEEVAAGCLGQGVGRQCLQPNFIKRQSCWTGVRRVLGLAGQSPLSAGFSQGSSSPLSPKPEISPWQEFRLPFGAGGGEEKRN